MDEIATRNLEYVGLCLSLSCRVFFFFWHLLRRLTPSHRIPSVNPLLRRFLPGLIHNPLLFSTLLPLPYSISSPPATSILSFSRMVWRWWTRWRWRRWWTSTPTIYQTSETGSSDCNSQWYRYRTGWNGILDGFRIRWIRSLFGYEAQSGTTI